MKKLFCIVFALVAAVLVAQDDDRIELSRGEIDAYNVTTIQELLNRLPGIYASESYVKIRGSSKVKVLVDGKPINNPLSSHSAIKWGLVSFASIDSIEIYRGAGAAMFGEGTDGGAIVVHRKKGGSSSSSLLLKGGNLGTFAGELSNQTSFGDHNIHSSYEDYRTDGHRENGDQHKYSFSISDQIAVADHQSLSVSSSYSWDERGSPGYPDYPHLHARQLSEALTTSAYYERGDGLKSNLYYRSFWTKSSDPDRDLLSELESSSVGNRTDLRVPLSGKRYLPLGLSFESISYEGTELEEQEEQQAAVYSSWMMRLIEGKPIYLSLTGRLNWYSEFDEVFDPSARITFKPGKWKFFASAGKGHVAPSVLKRYQSTSTRIANPDLGMEQTDKLEFGVGYPLSDKLNIQSMVYSKTTTDRITYTRLEEGMAQYRNIGEASWLGVETTLSGEVSSAFHYSVTHTWMDARDETNDLIITAAPKHRFQGEVEWTPIENLKLLLSGNYYARQFSRSDNTESVPSYFLLDAQIEYNWRGTQVFFKAENVLDRDFLYGDGLPGSPTEVIVGMKRNF